MGNARALCLDHLIGSLTPGKQADLILLRTDRPHMISAQDPVQAVVWYGQTSDVDTVMVAGSMVKRDGRLLRGDIGLRKAELQASAARLLQARRSALAAQARSIGAVAA